MTFSLLDWAIVLLYMAGIAAFGLLKGGKQTSAQDYFLSEHKIKWWAVAFAIVATETSALTFISVPGIAYATNLNFFQLSIGYIIGRIVVAIYFLPRYYDGELTTAYSLLERRFGTTLRKCSSVVFIGTRIFADGVRLYATAIPLVVLFRGYNVFQSISDNQLYVYAIVMTAAITVLYVQFGGVRAIIWTDVIQMIVHTIGPVASIVILYNAIPNFSDKMTELSAAGKLEVFHFSFENFFTKPYNVAAAVVGGAFLSMASHGTDYIIVQRLFATQSLSESRKALVASGVIAAFQFAMFLILGSLIYAFYGAGFRGDEAFPKFIVGQIPSGLAGLMIAGLLAAAMSTLSGSISSLAASSVFDLYAGTAVGKAASEPTKLRIAKGMSLVWAAVLTVSAVSYIGLGKAVVEVALSIASFTYGGLLGVFLLGVFFKNVQQRAALIGFATGILTMVVIITQTKLAWTFYTFTGSLITIATALLAEAATRKPCRLD
jgi:SSS family solute:Na+ symporter